jgi:predicted deacetylase
VSAWLDPLRRALDEAAHPVEVFFRDDDAGWAYDALRAVMDRFAAAGVPLDVAVIPAALTRRLTAELARRVADGGGLVALHQHGWAHTNHEPTGRSCEFGPSRSAADQRADVARGAAVLREAFGVVDAPVFVPPWNRCTATTASVLAELGLAVLSRDSTATPLPGSTVPELPVTADWFGKRRGVRVDREGRGELLAAAARERRPLGVMLHHAVMADPDLEDLGDLLRVVVASPAVRLRTMGDVARALPAAG